MAALPQPRTRRWLGMPPETQSTALQRQSAARRPCEGTDAPKKYEVAKGARTR